MFGLKEKWSSLNLSGYTAKIKTQIFGRNNERLDFLLDSFYKLSEQQQKTVMTVGTVGLVGASIFLITLYLSMLQGLDDRLNQSFQALSDLREESLIFLEEKSRYEQLKNKIQSGLNVNRVKPFFEEKARDISLNFQSIDDAVKEAEAPGLTEDFDQVTVKIRLSKVSIPKIIQFITNVEKSNQMIFLDDLRISGRYGTKLFFDANLDFKTYVVKG